MGFRDDVYALVQQVPAGRVSTYGDIGTCLGSPRLARQVGFALAGLRDDDSVPWHRVINAQGRISFRGDDIRGILQRNLLEADGVVFDDADRVALAELRWRFES